MEERHPDTAHDDAPGGDFARRLASRRMQAKQLLTAQRERADRIATQFQQRLQELENHSSGDTPSALDQTGELAARQHALQEREAQLRQLAESLSLREAQLGVDGAEIASQLVDLQLAREQLERQQFELQEQTKQQQLTLEQRAQAIEQRAHAVEQAERDCAQRQQALEARTQSLDQSTQAFEQRTKAFEQSTAELEQQRTELQQRSQQLQKRHGELEERSRELEALSAALKQEHHAIELVKEDQQRTIEQFQARRARQDEQQSRLDKELEELEQLREETRSQRRRIAQQLKAEHTALLHDRETLHEEHDRQRAAAQREIERAKTLLAEEREVQERELHRARQQLRHEREQLDEETASLATARQQWEESRRLLDKDRGEQQSAELIAAQQEIDRVTKLHVQLQKHAQDASERFAALQDEHAALQLQTAQQSASDANASAAVAELHAQNAVLADRVNELERRLAEAQTAALQPAVEDNQQFEDMQRRFQMAVDDVRQLKRKNAELEEQLAEQRSSSAAPVQAAAGEDWETTKRRLLESLDKEADGPGRMRADDRLTVEGAIRITDGIVAQRDQEIAELREQLAGQVKSADAAEMEHQEYRQSEHTAAVEAAFDQDDMIRQERQRLAQLEAEWQEKLRQAEVELSVHRAKISRERLEMEAQARKLEEEKAALKDELAANAGQAPGKPRKPTRRWLERLGLKETDGE